MESLIPLSLLFGIGIAVVLAILFDKGVPFQERHADRFRTGPVEQERPQPRPAGDPMPISHEAFTRKVTRELLAGILRACPACGEEITFNYCPQCGREMWKGGGIPARRPFAVFCERCYAAIRAHYCSRCGQLAEDRQRHPPSPAGQQPRPAPLAAAPANAPREQ